MNLDQGPIQLNSDFQYVLDALEHNRKNLFVTGRAGTGKSTLLQLFRKSSKRNVVVLAPTGVAALHAGGQTIHSFFGFPGKYLGREDIRKRRFRKLYDRMEVLVIDEISMVRADLLDAIDMFLRINRSNPQPFGGVQTAFFGDLYQLPPVVSTDEERHLFSSRYDSPYFFSADVMQAGYELETVILTQAYRQHSPHFLRLLDDIRKNRLDYEGLCDLNERCLSETPSDERITLCARNATANAINIKKLNLLSSPKQVYLASITGKFPHRLYPTDEALTLRIGTQVMFVKNDPKRAFVNGTIGTVTAVGDDTVQVRVQEEGQAARHIEVAALAWESIKYSIDDKDGNISSEVVGTFKQIPLKLAWAITIHKSQGKTFDRILVDLGRGAFEHGQTYVALSRCRTLEGIVLSQPIQAQDIRVDERIVDFLQQAL